jgi:hypothetical protein
MEVKDNKIIVEINVKDATKSATKEKQPKTENKAISETEIALNQGANVASRMPVVGPSISKFSNIVGSLKNFNYDGGLGGIAGVLSIASATMAILSLVYDTAKENIQNQRQSEELQRRAGYRRKQ